ncbi:Ubiquitin carboxyl-terminal hydrolase MINDY-1 [Taenia solium]|eukprot:TsM_000995500 transcript=TsM_000995500 gene=TsM_000995500
MLRIPRDSARVRKAIQLLFCVLRLDTNVSSSCQVSSPRLQDDLTPSLLKDTPSEEPKPFPDPEIPQNSEKVAKEETKRPLSIEGLPAGEGGALQTPKSDDGFSPTGFGEEKSLETPKHAEDVGIQEKGVGKPPSLKDLGEVDQAFNSDGATTVGLDKVGSQKTLQQAEESSEEKGVLRTSLVGDLIEAALASTADTVPALTDLDELDSNTFSPTSTNKTESFQDIKEPEGSQLTLHPSTQDTSPSRSPAFASPDEDFKDIPSTSEISDDQPPIQSSFNALRPTSTEPVSVPSKPSDSSEEIPKSATSKPPAKDGSVHQVKWISFNGSKVPIITQNENGPCPMIAITNVLLLRGKLTLPADHEVVSSDLIIAALSDELLSHSTAVSLFLICNCLHASVNSFLLLNSPPI